MYVKTVYLFAFKKRKKVECCPALGGGALHPPMALN
jgi:hypothetical protein